ncbi:MAG: FixH family protein [Caldilineaceae bacterium]
MIALTAMLQLVGCAAPAAPAGALVTEVPFDEQEQMSQQGLYRVRWQSDRGGVPLNALHTWTLHVQDAGGGPVAGARILVDGAMPAHNHGLPTQPMVTADLGDGDYRLEGMQFQMPGAWVISVTVESAAGADVVALPLTVAP